MSAPWLKARQAGILAHISSLAGAYGIGNLGQPARAFVEFLNHAGLRCWQICPAGPTGYADSPYQSFSSYAGNPYFIDLSEFETLGLLQADELAPLQELSQDKVDYGALYQHFWPLLANVADRFGEDSHGLPGALTFAAFQQKHAAWLRPYGLYMALKKFHRGCPWQDWPEIYRRYELLDESRLPKTVLQEARRHAFYQYVFHVQWHSLHAYAKAHDVDIIGDLPIFVAYDSADVWQNRQYFRIDSSGQPEVLSGVPPDYFSPEGQLWGNPLYNWDALKAEGYRWWIERVRHNLTLCDSLRLDHFRGFDSYWEIPADAPDAIQGAWREGPGMDFFRQLYSALPGARLIAEDLGYITEGVYDLRCALGLPGMKVMHFGYHHDDNNVNLPHFHTPNSVVYTGTHDNNTTRGWLESLPTDHLKRLQAYYGFGIDTSAWPIIRAAYASVARLAIIPAQDLLDLPESARMNKPSTTEGNWQWRMTPQQFDSLSANVVERIRYLNELYDRWGDDRQRNYSAPPSAQESAGLLHTTS